MFTIGLWWHHRTRYSRVCSHRTCISIWVPRNLINLVICYNQRLWKWHNSAYNLLLRHKYAFPCWIIDSGARLSVFATATDRNGENDSWNFDEFLRRVMTLKFFLPINIKLCDIFEEKDNHVICLGCKLMVHKILIWPISNFGFHWTLTHLVFLFKCNLLISHLCYSLQCKNSQLIQKQKVLLENSSFQRKNSGSYSSFEYELYRPMLNCKSSNALQVPGLTGVLKLYLAWKWWSFLIGPLTPRWRAYQFREPLI
jgi:hypothetical protein